MDSVKGITKQEFLDVFNIIQSGNPEKAWTELAYAMYTHKDFATGQPIDGRFILEQWKKYSIACQIANKDPKYIKSMENWIKNKEYLVNYDTKSTISYLDKYKKLGKK